MLAKVYVTYKNEVLDPQGKTVREALENLGFNGVDDVRQGKYFEIQLDKNEFRTVENAKIEIKSMCEKLLSNPVIEEYRFDIEEK